MTLHQENNMNENDRELLELAAKAVGINGSFVPDIGLVFGENRTKEIIEWNPLTDDGDALRLAVNLRIDVIHNESQDNNAWVMAGDFKHVEDVDGEGNRATATRRAIVRAAAEVAKGQMSHEEFVLMFPGRFEEEEVARAAAEIAKQMKG